MNVDNVSGSEMLATVTFLVMNQQKRFISLIHGSVLTPLGALSSVTLSRLTI